ncbi:hypothetical protein Tco_0947008 [Tanacetum coccineum]
MKEESRDEIEGLESNSGGLEASLGSAHRSTTSICVHDTFHVSNFKKCLAEPDVQVPLDEIEIDENLHFVEEPIEILERDVKKLKRRRIPLVKVRWKKYPNLFSKPVPSSGVAT